MAYTPYSQALPDTSRYTLDPVLQERLYQPVRPDPYQAGMLNSWANDYYADPFGYTNKRFGILDEVLKKDTPNVNLGGMFAPPKPYENAGGPGDGPGGPTGPGQGISNTGINVALGLLGITEGPLGYTTPGAIANLAAQAYLDNQLDALDAANNALSANSTPDAFGLTGVAQTGMNTVSDENGNVTTVSNDATIAAQNEALFGFDGSTAQAPSQSTATSQAASGSGMGPDGASSSGGDSGGGCCFIMLEARYGDGTMDSVVRKYRDEMMTDKNRRGYYKLAEVFVPLMRKSKVFKFLVKKTFADPLVSYGQWHYKENKHGWLFAPLKNLWMKVFNILGSDTQFIRENGEVV